MQTAALISKDEQLKNSVVYVGYLILKQIKQNKQNKVSIFELAAELNKKGIIHYRQILFALLFLHACGLIDFKEPYIYKAS